jgi:stearoyl-CoA desaturase (delta-9 desaturase)
VKDEPARRTVDRALATVVTFVPPLAFGLVLYLHWTGWARISGTDIALYAVMHLSAVAGVELGYHRLFAHGSYKANRGVKIALAICGSFAFQGPVIWWAAVHRKHHRHSDRPFDPHSIYIHPDGRNVYRSGFLQHVLGFIHSHVGWIWTPHSTRFPGWGTYVRDLYRDKDLLRIHLYYPYFLAAGLLLPAAAAALLTGTLKGALTGFLWGGFVRVFFTNHLSYWSINTLSHSIGARPFRTADHSTNSIPLLFAIPTLGQSYHNNHHAFPYSARMTYHWYELDLGLLILRFMQVVGWVWDLREPTPLAKKQKRIKRPAEPTVAGSRRASDSSWSGSSGGTR